MFGLGWTEILIIALAAFIFLKPEDLPKLTRKLGLMVGNIRKFVDSVSIDWDRLGEEEPDESGTRINDEEKPAGGRKGP